MPEFITFARAIEDPWAKTACIRRVFISMPDYLTVPSAPPDAKDVAKEVRSCLPVVLQRLSARLDVLHIDCERNHYVHHEVVYESLKAAQRQNPAWAIDVQDMAIGARHDDRDIFPHFAFARNVRHLAVTVTDRDGHLSFNSPSNVTELQSLVVGMKFSEGIYRRLMPEAAKAASDALRPACTKLQSLTLILCEADVVDIAARTKSLKTMLSISTNFVTYLHLRTIPGYVVTDIAKELAAATEFPKFPALRHLRLDGCGISAKAIRQMGCSELRKLEVIIMKSSYDQGPWSQNGSRCDGKYMLGCVMDVLKLPEVENLDSVAVSFDSGATWNVDHPGEEGIPVDWTGTRKSWGRLERACANRNITCVVEHPDEP